MSITNENLVYLLENQHKKECTEELAHALLYLADACIQKNFGEKYPELVEDMIGQALVDLCRSHKKFDTKKSNKPLDFFEVCIYSSGLWLLVKDRKESLPKQPC